MFAVRLPVLRTGRGLLQSRPRPLSTAAEQLKVFPEYMTALEAEQKGDVDKSLMFLQRVEDIAVHSMGVSSPLSAALLFHKAQLLRRAGKYQLAVKTLAPYHNDAIDVALRTKASQIVTSCHLLSNQLNEALRSAEYGLSAAEMQRESDVDVTVFSSSYALYGITQFLRGEHDDAESFLQLAARWARNPTERLTSLSNLAAVFIRHGNAETASSLSGRRLDLLSRHYQAIMSSKAGDSAVSEALSKENAVVKENTHYLEAASYFTEAVQDAIAEPKGSGRGAADAMCGVTTSKDHSDIGMTGLGSDVKIVNPKKEASSSGAVTAESEKELGLEDRLKQLDYALLYANTLVNQSVLDYFVRGIDLSDELLASALKSLEHHQHDARAQASLGRILAYIALSHMENKQAISAEGLFRSAIDKLSHKYDVHDSRTQLEHALASAAYGLMLSKWDKREQTGLQMHSDNLRRAQLLTASQPLSTSFLQFPV